jgi:asparagine synthetase B (glutamine-hydrolysing)
MCGIWGVFPTDTKGFYPIDMGLFESAMTMTAMRGSHSTGMALVAGAKEKPRVVKTVGGPAFLINTDAWEKITEFATKKAKVAFGHGRFATKGSITNKNAHPFTHDHITLVHNGTIHMGLKEQHTELETEVDSHALCALIAQKGLVEALSTIYGAYALVVHDAKEGCVYVVRNDERPLHRIVMHDKHIILSEWEACKYLAFKLGVPNAAIEHYPKHMIFKYDIASAEWTVDNSLKELMEKKYAPTITTPWTGSTPSKHGGNIKWGEPKGNRETTYYCVIDLLCTKIEPVENSKQFRYYLHDDNGFEYHALSAYNYKENEGEIARCNKHMKMTDRSTGEVTRFVKYRDLVWVGTKSEIGNPPPPEQVETKEENKKPVVTYNSYLLTREAWQSYVAKEDCACCGGSIAESEAENTILTQSKTLICGDCIKDGKHYSLGYGQ